MARGLDTLLSVESSSRAKPRIRQLKKSRHGWRLARYRMGRVALRATMALGLVVLIGLAVIVGTGLFIYKDYADGFVTPDQLGVNRPSGGATILDRNGKLLYR